MGNSKKQYMFTQNEKCEFFPCHPGVEREKFNCLFCYCPLYPLKDCGGNYTYTKNGCKDCSDCTMPHIADNYSKVTDGCADVIELVRKKRVQSLRSIVIWCAVTALIALAVCILAPRLAVENLWRIPELLDAPEVTQVLVQLKDASIVPGFISTAIITVLITFLAWLMRRHRIAAIFLLIPSLLAGFIAALMCTVVNGVPVHTIVSILLEYLRLGAF